MPVDLFLRAMMRDVAWGFFYGTVNFDDVFGTTNHYGNVDVFAGLYNSGYRKQNEQHVENFKSDDVMAMFEAMLEDWTNEGFDPVRRAAGNRQRLRPQARQQQQGDHAQTR